MASVVIIKNIFTSPIIFFEDESFFFLKIEQQQVIYILCWDWPTASMILKEIDLMVACPLTFRALGNGPGHLLHGPVWEVSRNHAESAGPTLTATARYESSSRTV